MSASATGNAVGILCTHDLMFYSQVTGAARSLGKNIISVRSVDDLLTRLAESPAKCLFLDLMLPGLEVDRDIPRIRDACVAGLVIVAYGPHVQVARLEQAEAAGCDAVMPRSRFSSSLNALIEQYLPACLET